MPSVQYSQGDYTMSDLDLRALEANFQRWKADRMPDSPNGDAFERYAIETVLKDYDLSDDEIDSGHIAGGDDGGVDGVYFFINRTLVQDDTDLPDPVTVQLVLIQAKYESGFGETAIEKLQSFTRDMLDYSIPVDQLVHLNSFARDVITRFRDGYNEILGTPHALSVEYHYVTKSDVPANPKVENRVRLLQVFVASKLSAASFSFTYWGCAAVLAAVRTAQQLRLNLTYTRYFNTSDQSTVSLIQLKSFAEALKDENGELRRSVLEPNVRAYQGKRNLVNQEIQKTLKIPVAEAPEFWWLNNGITILAEKCAIVGDKLVIDQPEIVNGLQTTQEIFNHFDGSSAEADDSRSVLIRVIIPPEETTRNQIIKATNNQTPVNPLSLHATDRLHFDIEDKLALYNLFYDRRKGYYRHLRKEISEIISPRDLARAVIAIVLQQANNARARPQSLTNDKDKYPQVFNDAFNRDVFVACILLDRQVDAYLDSREDITSDERRDTRYYVDMWLASELTGKANPTPDAIAALVPRLVTPILMESAVEQVLSLYRESVAALVARGVPGAADKVAKGPDFNLLLLAAIAARFPEPILTN